MSGWVCYLQMQRAGEHWAEEAREATEAEQEEYDALKEAARSYLTRAKKVCVSYMDGTASGVVHSQPRRCTSRHPVEQKPGPLLHFSVYSDLFFD